MKNCGNCRHSKIGIAPSLSVFLGCSKDETIDVYSNMQNGQPKIPEKCPGWKPMIIQRKGFKTNWPKEKWTD